MHPGEYSNIHSAPLSEQHVVLSPKLPSGFLGSEARWSFKGISESGASSDSASSRLVGRKNERFMLDQANPGISSFLFGLLSVGQISFPTFSDVM